MVLEAEFLKELTATFKIELDERLQIITDCLLALEKKNQKAKAKKIIEEIFRAAHNIKGSARSIGIIHISDIAHQIETLFSSLASNSSKLSKESINLCLQAVDSMRLAMESTLENKPLSFDLDDLLRRLQENKPLKALKPQTFLQAKPEPAEPHDRAEFDSIRVAISQIDRVSALVEQIQASKIALEEHSSDLQKWLSGTKSQKNMPMNQQVEPLSKAIHKQIKEFSSLSNNLQEEVSRLRLIPASTLLRQLVRSVHDLASELNKKVELEIHGDQVKMDKLILEGLKDPLIHLLRNAIDHGIESPKIRKNLGKPEVGTICLEIIDKGNQIGIHVSDDGAGIDPKKIASLALGKKIISQAELENMDEASILELIFRPGFSSKEIITDISGRGIGLDIVKARIGDLKGQLSFTSKIDKGTSFNLKLPLTLSSDRGLIIKSSGQLFVIPTAAVEHVLVLKAQDIHAMGTKQIILFNNKPIVLSNLSDLLHLKTNIITKRDRIPILLLKKGRDRVALLLEDIIGEREMVIKPLNKPLVHIPCIAGGTLLGSNEVILVLNTNDLLRASLSTTSNRLLWEDKELEAKSIPQILLVEDSITTRSLEKNILESNNYKVTVAVDGKEAWDILQKQSFSLVITDIDMPNMDGLELTELIKKSENLQDLPVIIVTSLGNEEQKKRGIEVGASAYIVKHDFESGELLEIVSQLV